VDKVAGGRSRQRLGAGLGPLGEGGVKRAGQAAVRASTLAEPTEGLWLGVGSDVADRFPRRSKAVAHRQQRRPLARPTNSSGAAGVAAAGAPKAACRCCSCDGPVEVDRC